jgi:hypothetical protein
MPNKDASDSSIEPKAGVLFDRCCGRDIASHADIASTMPHTWTNTHDVRATPAGARSWGPGSTQSKTWACGISSDAASPPPKSAAATEMKKLVATKHGAVLVMLPDGADHDDILAALQDAHTRIQREIHANRTKRIA